MEVCCRVCGKNTTRTHLGTCLAKPAGDDPLLGLWNAHGDLETKAAGEGKCCILHAHQSFTLLFAFASQVCQRIAPLGCEEGFCTSCGPCHPKHSDQGAVGLLHMNGEVRHGLFAQQLLHAACSFSRLIPPC